STTRGETAGRGSPASACRSTRWRSSPSGRSAPSPASGSTGSSPSEPARPMPPPVKLLVLASYPTPEELAADRVAARMMLPGLARAGIDWRLHQPWLPCPDLADFDAVLCWTYRWQVARFPFWAWRIERQADELGIPVVNRVERCAEPHSYFLATWRERGVPCARARPLRHFHDS